MEGQLPPPSFNVKKGPERKKAKKVKFTRGNFAGLKGVIDKKLSSPLTDFLADDGSFFGPFLGVDTIQQTNSYKICI